MSLVTRTPLALEIGHRDLPNRVGLGHVWVATPRLRPNMANTSWLLARFGECQVMTHPVAKRLFIS